MYVMSTGCLGTFYIGNSYKRYINCRFGYLGYLVGRLARLLIAFIYHGSFYKLNTSRHRQMKMIIRLLEYL